MLFIQKVCALAVVPFAITCGLIVEEHPWAAIFLLLCAMVCAWIAVQEPPPRPLKRLHRWPDDGAP
jgi:hypothetical protein